MRLIISAGAMGILLSCLLVGMPEARAGSVVGNVGPTCIKYKKCRMCSQKCLNPCRRKLKQCRKNFHVGYRRCMNGIKKSVRKCFARSQVICSRRCRIHKTSKRRTCSRVCVRRISNRCKPAYFARICKKSAHKARHKCKPQYRRCVKPCCGYFGRRQCRRSRICKRVTCARAPCPPVCRCAGRYRCSRICKRYTLRLHR